MSTKVNSKKLDPLKVCSISFEHLSMENVKNWMGQTIFKSRTNKCLGKYN